MTQDEIAAMRDLALQLMAPLTQDLLRDICRRVSEAGQITSTAEYQLFLSRQLGLADKTIVDALRRQSNLTDKAINEMMTLAANRTVAFDDNESLQQQIKAYVQLAKKNTDQLLYGSLGGAGVDGKVYPLKQLYKHTMDYAFKQVFSGALTPTNAVRRATQQLANRGIRTIDRASGRTVSIEYAARQTIMSQMGELTQEVSQQNHDKLGMDGWEISAHSGCAPDHEFCQGRQYSDKEFKQINSRLQRRIGTLSCKHYAMPIKIGINRPQYTTSQLDAMEAKNSDGINFEGKHYTLYEAQQQQSAIENHIRILKNRVLVDKETDDGVKLRIDQLHLGQLNDKYRKFSAGVGLRTAPERLQIAGMSQSIVALNKRTELPHPTAGYIDSSKKFDSTKALVDYSEFLDTLTGTPEKNKLYLKYYTTINPVKLVEGKNLSGGFAYDSENDCILYDTAAKAFVKSDFDIMMTHELAHKIDFLNIQSWKNKEFLNAIEVAKQRVSKDLKLFEKFCWASKNSYLSDIIDALSEGQLNLPYIHGKEYWAKDSDYIPIEIYSELFSIETFNNRELAAIQQLFPDLWKAYAKLL